MSRLTYDLLDLAAGKKPVTVIRGLPDRTQAIAAVKYLKKELHCNGCVTPLGGEHGTLHVIHLQGDQRERARAALDRRPFSLEQQAQ